ncbi:NifU N-terminal domain-containing protein [Sporolactobacillus laevolacticus]|uniref:NifU N-terminal domain-containing protein n=1 Tax=Sporolactobacillus laevolacticus TaxID=33018 RepID=UPI0025B31A26|nr:NifU N-terminal domain-containing protein [Sporolactobacillus laevolacticus]MDN3954219.1 NifU N-terminal domain-containing protein [Sporolactobacillus laevolacticus]
MPFTSSPTPNPNALKFTSESQLFNQRIEIKKGTLPGSPLLRSLIEIDGVDRLFGHSDFITVCKLPTTTWDQILPQVETILNPPKS